MYTRITEPMNTTTPFISVIIPVYNDPIRLRDCLECLQNQTYPRDCYEVIVVDNGSDESVVPIVREFNCATTTNESRKGSYAARNKGISLAKANVFAFTDSDCRPTVNWLETGVSNLLTSANCGLVAGEINLYVKDPNHLTSVEIYETVIAFPQRRYVEEFHFGATANIFTRKDVMKKVGLFNPNMRSGGDREWGNRVYAAGFNLFYAENVCVYHPARRTFREIYRKATRVGRGIDKTSIKTILKAYIRILFVPPVELLRKGLTQEKLSKFQKIQFVLVVFFVKYTIAWQKTRMLFGAEAKR